MFELKGKVALITGAASGFGFAISKRFLQSSLKAVVLVDIDEDNGQRAVKELTQEFGDKRAIFKMADVTDENQLKKAFDAAVQCYNQLDIVVNNAAVGDENNWERLLQVNLMSVIRGTFLAIQDYFPKYKSTSEALIVNIASNAGLYPVQDLLVYTTSKFGMVGFTRAVGGDQNFQKTNVKVIAICPGAMDTQLLARHCKKTVDNVDVFAINYGKVVLHPQKPEDVAHYAVEVMEKAPSGSVWTLDNAKFSQVEFLINKI